VLSCTGANALAFHCVPMFLDLSYQEGAVQGLPPFSGLLAVPQVRRESVGRSKK
jgi:hypothetical protein